MSRTSNALLTIACLVVVAASCKLLAADAPATEADVQPEAVASPIVGSLVRVKIDDQDQEKNINGRLHFCLFEDGEADKIYVGTKYGMWSKGEFDLTIDGKKVYTGRVPHLLYGGTILDIGDVIDQQPKSSKGIYVTRVAGWFK